MSRMTSLILGLRNQAGGPRWLGMAMAALIAVTLCWVGMHAWPVIRTSQLPAKPANADRTDDQRRSEFAAALKKHQAVVDGRSLFFIPPRPRPPRPAYVEDSTPREAPKPTRYGGPSMIAMVNGAVLFADGQRLKVGESGRSVKVISVSAPWTAKLEYEGVEFDVELFQRDSTIVRPASHSTDEPTPLTPPASSESAPATAKPVEKPAPAGTPPSSAAPAGNPPASPSPGSEPTPQSDPQPEPQPEPSGEPEPAAAPSTPPAPPASPESQPTPSAPESP